MSVLRAVYPARIARVSELGTFIKGENLLTEATDVQIP
jgi:hypothetical protein